VEAAEAKLHGDVPDPAVFRAAIDGLVRQPGGERMDAIVLACTHFPLVAAELAAAAPPGVEMVDGADGIARRCAVLLKDRIWGDTGPGRAIITASGAEALSDLDRLAPALQEFGLMAIERFSTDR
jgi:glutamate racemase